MTLQIMANHRLLEHIVEIIEYWTKQGKTALSNSNLAHEIQLIARMASRDSKAMSELYDLYSGLLYSVVFKITRVQSEAEEVLQDVFVSAWDNAHKFDPKKAKVFTWLMTIARNKAIDRVRSKAYKVQQASSGDEFDKIESATISPLNSQLAKDNASVIKEALNGLPEDQKKVIQLSYYEGQSQSQVAETLGIPLGTVKTRMRLGMMKLTEELKNRLGDNYAA